MTAAADTEKGEGDALWILNFVSCREMIFFSSSAYMANSIAATVSRKLPLFVLSHVITKRTPLSIPRGSRDSRGLLRPSPAVSVLCHLFAQIGADYADSWNSKILL